uniref:Deleted in malignant brain tumors 1 protein-like n=1 Tax=Crassostrea virginica TaxID=6565 RepID=A0A8B8E5G8_CRAVI|nr:deleted in malignant brain tumors 1 protein-like [Crassostrea virginica]
MEQFGGEFFRSQLKLFMWILMYIQVNIESISSTCDVTTREITADSNWRSLTSMGYQEGGGSYINNMNCWWRIDAGADDLKLLLFLTYDLACPGDKIYIYDGSDATSTALDNGKCGTSNTPTHYSTSQRHAYIVMVTDASIQRAGFKLEYLAAKDYSGNGCSSTQTLVAGDDSRFLSSPNFPGLYPNSRTCRWLITSTTGNVDLDVVFSDIEDDLPTQCSYDKYFINDGNDRCDMNGVRTVCSQYPKVTPFTFTSSGSSVVVSFFSDSNVNRRGFLMKYKSNATETTTAATQTTESSTQQTTTAPTQTMELSTPQTTSSTAIKSLKDSNTCMDVRIVIGIVFGCLVVVIFSCILVVLMVIRFYNLRKTVKPNE